LAILVSLSESLYGVTTREALNPTPPFLTDDDVEQLPAVQFLVDRLIPIGAAAEVHGPPGSGKSFLALALACCVATGRGFCGHDVKRGAVVYVVGEGLAGIGARVRAWKTEYGAAASAGLYFRNGPVHLLDPIDVTRFVARVKALEAPPALIVLDTLARCMVGGDENSAKDMGLVIAAIDRIRHETGAAILIVHHTRKDGEQERGSTALRGAIDAMLAVKNDAGSITIACEKQKDAAEFQPIVLRLKPVGPSCVLISVPKSGETGGASLTLSLTAKHVQALQSVSRDFLDDDGATAANWQEASKVPRSSFFRVLKDLVTGGYVDRVKKGNSTRYVISDTGRDAVGLKSHGSPKPVPETSKRRSLTDSPPLKGGIGDETETENLFEHAS
jgi:hypothetical protein